MTDITYLATSAGWVYLAMVIDLFSRKLVGWSISQSLATDLAQAALKDTIEKRRPNGSQLRHHCDRGCQYTSLAYQQTLRTLGIKCSMSGTGSCYDNAVAERFFWILKHEWTNYRTYADLEAARQSVFANIELFYNQTRLHQTLAWLSPAEFESCFENNMTAASQAVTPNAAHTAI